MSSFRYSFPPSFDENVASLSVRGKTNDPSDKFTLSLTSSFGQCQVRIGQQSDYIDAQMRVYKANISIEYVNSHPSRIIFNGQAYDTWKVQENIQLGTKRTSEIGNQVFAHAAANFHDRNFVGKLSFGGKSELSGRAIRGKNFQQSVVADRDHSVVRILSPDMIDISYPQHLALALEGQFLGDEDILDVIPINKSKNYGVVVRILIREPWITFSDISVVGTSRFARNLSSLIGIGVTLGSRKMFQRLLAHLVVAKLQDEQEAMNACLAIRGAFFDVEKDLTIHTFSKSKSPGLIVIDSSVLQKFIAGDDVDRKQILSGISFDEHFLTGMEIIAPSTNEIAESNRIDEISSRFSRVHSWSDLFPIPGNKSEVKEWSKIYSMSNPKYHLDGKNPFLFYLYSLARYPLIPEEHWVNICTYTRYKYDNLSLRDLFFRNGQRSVLATNLDLMQIDSSYVINFSSSDDKTNVSYDSGSWIVGDVALTIQNYSENEDSLFQYAVCLDSAKEIISQFDASVVSDAIITFAADKRVQDLNRIVPLIAVLQEIAHDRDVLKALSIMDSSAAPSSQLGIINLIKSRNKDVNVSEIHAKRQKDLIDLTKFWIEKMSVYYEGLRYEEEDGTDYFYLGAQEGMKPTLNKI